MLEPCPGTFLAAVGDDVIMLDLGRDEYAAAPPRLSSLLQAVFSPAGESPEEARVQWLIDERILVASPTRTTPYVLPAAAEPGGVRDVLWRPSGGKVIAEPADTAWSTVATATWLLHRAHCLVGRGIAPVVTFLHRRAARLHPDLAWHGSLDGLVEAHIRARMIYPRFTQCLASATAFAVHAWRLGADVEFVIGVQSRPFYAHAWVERAGVVVNDSLEINRKLAPILRVGPTALIPRD